MSVHNNSIENKTSRDSLNLLNSLPHLHRHEISNSEVMLARENQILIQKIGELSMKLLEAERQITIDKMTGCYNRNYFEKFLDEFDINSRYSDIGLIFTDLNNLKQTNDTLGHEKGDELIISMADFLKVNFRKNCDSIVRLGGDEFVVICHNYENNPDFSIDLQTKIKDIKSCGSTPNAAWGVAVFDSEIDSDIKDTFNRADNMMYIDKAQSKIAKL